MSITTQLQQLLRTLLPDKGFKTAGHHRDAIIAGVEESKTYTDEKSTEAIKKEGDQTIQGILTLEQSPVVPDATMPQHPMTLNQGIVKTQIKQTTGTSESDLMSQKAVTDAIDETKMVTDARVSSLENTLNSANINQETTATVSGVDTVTLPKTAANTGMQVQMFGQSATNLIENGDFRNGTTGWTLTNVTSISVPGGILMQKTNTESLMKINKVGTVVAENIYYSQALLKCSMSPSSTEVMFGQFNNSLVINSNHLSYAQSTLELQTLSNRGTLGPPTSYFFGVGARSTYAGTISVYRIRVINLTATYGAGNEPTKEQCDLLFANYFEGIDNVLGTGRVRSVGKNLFNGKIINGSYYNHSTGDIVSSTDHSYSPYFVKVLPNKTYVFRNNQVGNVRYSRFLFYDIKKAFISGVVADGTSGSQTVTTPFNCEFVRVSNGGLVIYGTASNDKWQIELGSTATTYEPYRESILQLTTPELRSNGLIKDEIRKGTNGYELVKRVGVGTLGANEISGGNFEGGLIGTYGDTGGATINWALNNITPISGTADGRMKITVAGTNPDRPVLSFGFSGVVGTWYKVSFNYKVNSGVFVFGGLTDGVGRLQANIPLTGSGEVIYYLKCGGTSIPYGSLYMNSTSMCDFQIDNYSIKKVIAAEAITAGSTFTELGANVHYTLATPVITPIAHAGLLNSNSNGTAYFEPIIADAGVYSTNLTVQLTDYPIASFESIRKYANGTYTELNIATATIAVDGLSFTHTGLTSGDLVMFTYAYNKESIGRSMTLTHYDSRFVEADTVNGRVYRIVPVVTNGVVSWTTVEV